MIYAKVINNEIVEHNRTLPFSTETTSFGIGADAETLKSYGYLPVVGTEPEYDRVTHKIGNITYTVGENEVIKTYEVVFDTPAPTVGELEIAYQDGTEIDSKGNRVIKWSVKNMFIEYIKEDGTVVTVAEQEAEYLDKLMQNKIKSAEQAVQSHINAKCVSLGYDNENSIAKYLVEGNPFYEECKSLSLWIGNVWVKAFSIINEVRPIPTIEEILAELPEFI